MRRLFVTALMIVWGLCAIAADKSQTIVYINGSKYYIHTVQAGETLYALSKLYNVDKSIIVKHNPSVSAGLKVAENIKIPVTEEKVEKLSPKKMRKTFDTHIVSSRETLYGIARLYEISIKTIMEDNPQLDPTRMKAGDKILIRKKMKGKEEESETQAQWEQYRDHLNSVTKDSTEFYIVNKGDTFYALSHRFHITEQQLSNLNQGLQPQDLKAGAMIRIPSKEQTEAMNRQDTMQVEEVVSPSERPIPHVEFQALRANEQLKVGLLLPMIVDGQRNNNYVEFYKGFLMGLDSVKHRVGRSIDVTLYNTARSEEKIQSILEASEFEGTRLIVGPVYETELYPVVRYAEKHEIPMVTPLAHIENLKSDALFQMAPDTKLKYKKVEDLFADDKQVTLIYSTNTDKAFEEEMLTLLGNKPYQRYQYVYEHPSKLKEDEVSPSDLTPLLTNKDDNVFIIMSKSEIDVDRIMAALASANTNLVARGMTAPKFCVLGNTRWNRFSNIDRTMFFKNRVIFMSNYHAKRDSDVVANFDKAYFRAFGSMPSMFSYRGYDAAMIFCPAMYNDIEYNMEDRRYTPLQTSYLFHQEDEQHNHVNDNWTRVNYNDNFTITIE